MPNPGGRAGDERKLCGYGPKMYRMRFQHAVSTQLPSLQSQFRSSPSDALETVTVKLAVDSLSPGERIQSAQPHKCQTKPLACSWLSS